MAIICAFGDSNTYGVWDFEEYGWVARLRKLLDRRNESDPDRYCDLVYNCGVDGETSANLLDRLECEARARFRECEEYDESPVAIIGIGGNDAMYFHDRRSQAVPPRRFRANVRGLLRLTKRFTPSVLFVGPAPVNESKTDPIEWDRNLSWRNRDIGRYSQIAEEVCRAERVPFINMFTRLSGQRVQCFDGLHLNHSGHRQVYEAVREILSKKRWI